jgi:hypothetical protein
VRCIDADIGFRGFVSGGWMREMEGKEESGGVCVEVLVGEVIDTRNV